MPNGAVGQLQLHTRPPKWHPASRLTCPRSEALRYRLQFARQSAEGVAEWCEVVCVRMHAIGMWMVACVCTTHMVVAAPVATPGVTLGCPKAGTHVQAAAACRFRCWVSSSMWCPWLQGHVHRSMASVRIRGARSSRVNFFIRSMSDLAATRCSGCK